MESKEEMSVKLLCMACLCFGRNLRELKDEKLKQYYLDVLSEVPLFSTLPVCPIVCWECEAFLRKAFSFKEQCKDSYRILQTYTNEDLKERLFTEVMCQPALKVHKQESISIKPEEGSRYANDEGMFVYAGVKNEENSSCCCGSQAANNCKKITKMYENDIFKEEMNELNEVGNDFDEPDVLSVSNEKDFPIIAMASKQKCVYVKEESKKTMEIASGLDNVLQDGNEDTSRLLEIEVPVPPSIDGNEDKKRKKKTNRVKKKVKNNKENLKQRRLSVDTCQLDTQKPESTNDEIVDGIFSYGDVKMEERSSSVINKANDQPKDDYIDLDEKLTDFKAEIHHLDDFDNDFEDLGALNIKDEGTTKIVGIEVALKTLIGDKDTKRKKLNTVKGRKRLKEKKKKVTTQILTVDMTYEEMLRERDVEGGRERYLKSEYKCESCLLGFSHEGAYREHNRRRHDKALGDYSCPICKTVIPSVDSFTAHYKRHTRRYECAICHKRTLDLKVMQQHYYSNHEIALKEYKCSVCGKISKSIEAHRYHKDSHKARIQCPECEKTYRHRAGLMNHRVAVHEFRNAFPCNKCDKVFRWKTSLKRHLEKHEVKAISNPAPAFCSLCNVSFASISSYQRHLKNSLKHVTQDQLKYICDHCNRRFADKTKLRDHIEEKHLYRTFQCHICLKPSKNRVGLDQHIRNVHKGRPHNAICHFCGKRFPTRVQLESHVRTHTGERPFICEYCPTTFSQQSNLYKHNRQVHLNIKSKKFPMCRKRKEDRPQVVENPTAGDAFPTPMAVWRYSPQRGIIM